LRASRPAFALMLVASTVLADASEDEARGLFKQGVTMLQAGAFEHALDQFERAYELWKNPKILLNIATTLRELGRLPEAADAYELYQMDPGADPERAEEVRKALADIDAKVVRLRVEVVTPGAVATINGTPLQRKRKSTTGRIVRTMDEPESTHKHSVRVMPGEHTIAASLDGYEPWSQVVVGEGGDEKALRIELKVAPSKVTEPAAQEPEHEPTLSHGGQWMLFTRADVDGRFRGAVGVVGGGFALGSVVELQLAALLGRDKGFEPGASFYFATGTFKPLAYVGVPTFFVDGASPGGHVAIGLQIDPSRSVGVLAQLGLATFLNVPSDRESTAFVPSVGVQGRF
jgi:hypothetical protein